MREVTMKVLVLLAVVGVAYSQTCCSPDQWEGVSILISGADKNGVTSKTQVRSVISYDFEDMLLARTIEFMDGGMSVKNKSILNYNTKMAYNYDMNTLECTTMTLDTPFDRACTPANGKEAGSFYYGIPSDMLKGNSMSFTDGETSGIYVYTPDMCIPLSEIVFGQMGAGTTFITTEDFRDITPGIKDPSVFMPPPSCQQFVDERTPMAELRRGGLGLPIIDA